VRIRKNCEKHLLSSSWLSVHVPVTPRLLLPKIHRIRHMIGDRAQLWEAPRLAHRIAFPRSAQPQLCRACPCVRDVAIKKRNWCEKSSLFSRFYKLIVSHSKYPPISIHRCIRIFHYSKQCCRSSADTLFSRSAVFISPHQQTENDFLSTQFSVWGKGKSHRGLNPVNGRGAFEQRNAFIG
jgi:hypothetical protein